VVEFGLRVSAPLVAAGLWWMSLTADLAKPADAIAWKITPRRIAVYLGLAEAGKTDLVKVDRDRHVAKLARVGLATRMHEGGRLHGRRVRRLRRLALVADAAMVDEAVARVDRCDKVVERMLGVTEPAPEKPKPKPTEDAWDRSERFWADGGDTIPTADAAARKKAEQNGHKPSRRPIAETRRMYEELLRDQPSLSIKAAAALLNLSERGLRDALARSTSQPAG
jgi:hypothetical protein